MDGLLGLEKAFKEEFPQSETQRFWVHSLGNEVTKAPSRLRDELKMLAQKVMYASSEENAKQDFFAFKETIGRTERMKKLNFPF